MKVISKKHLFIILIFFLISILFLLFGVRNFKGAFPEASLDFKYSRKEIQGICDNFLREQGFDLDDSYSKTIIFSQDSTAGVFIDKEFGIEKLEELNRKGFNIWSWRCRRFKPLQKEEFKISFNTEGKLKEFQHIYEEARPGANLEQSEALLIAEVFLKETVGLDFNKLVLKEEKQIRQPNRTDYHFEWEVRGFNLDDAVYRYIIKIQGNEVGSYREYLKVPEKWTRGYRKLRSGNNLYQSISTIFYVLLMVVIIINFIYRFRKKDIKFKLAFRFGILIFILQVLSHLNMYPFYLAEYDVTNSFSAFIIQFSFAGLALGLLQGFLIFLAVASGESIYREYFKKKIQLSVLFSKNGFSLTETLLGSIWGYILAMFHIGFVILFYIKSKDFGVWAPAGTEYTEMVNTVIPWIFPLTIGVMASVSEEFTFRVFAIPFFKKLTKSDFLAVIIPAFLWGFLHSNYPQQPGYIRGIEIGIIGIVAGIIMIRYGILATLIWHYAIDAALVGMFLFGSSNLYFIISGLIVVGIVFIPLVLSLISYFRNKGFSDNPDILNEADQLEVTKTKEVHFNHPGLEYVKMKPSKLLILGVLIVLIFIWLISVRSYSPITLFSKPETTVKEAEARAKKFL
ncbi:CPBP family intramembrane metalloprotease, partial [Candidatus Dependentiae bacterium]|nr:CPBP family intramembrane metalloprotease [Candidatus Dependentiae bacterium]